MYDLEKIKAEADYCLNCKNKKCQEGCPLENDIPSFISLMKEEKWQEAYDVLTETTALSAVCGLVCPHEIQCQSKCIRGIKGNPVHIGCLEAYLGKLANDGKIKISGNIINKGKSVAIIGGGPTGLTAGFFLRKSGYKVTIYEKEDLLGGVLNYGIPEFRLPKEIVNKNIDIILKLGIEVKNKVEFGKDIGLQELMNIYDAVLLAIGSKKPEKMNIPGEELDNVYYATELLRTKNYPDFSNKKVAIIGGGNVAMDIARTIKRQKAEEVSIIYRREEEQMPATKKEINSAKKDGVNFLLKTNIVKIIGEGKVQKIECIKTELIKKDKEEKPIPVNIEGSNYIKEMDYVVMAIGSKLDRSCIDKNKIKINEQGYIETNNYKTNIKGVFAAGDGVRENSTIAWASRSGRNVAKEIEKFLNSQNA